MDKVPPGHLFFDVSDYARPAARWLVRALLQTAVTPQHLTLAFTAAGLTAAILLAAGRWLGLAAVLLLVKSGLDGADGALARARRRPSRVGRFLDSVCDFVVNVAVYGGIVVSSLSGGEKASVVVLGAVALVSALLQVSVFNYFYLRYRTQTGGDQTSHVVEDDADGYPWDDPVQLRWLYLAYRAIYGWQDHLVAWLDRRLTRGSSAPLSRGFMTAASVLGLGTQLLVIAACAVAGRPNWALRLFATVFNLYALALLGVRRGARR
ncbi:MAG: CDP-alcohol phosphatidyltransferase family protein [Anaerolineales bacterium]|nr:CDP-alcohol phosphatidyltransferase family protein [Anaerolineales bacterium]